MLTTDEFRSLLLKLMSDQIVRHKTVLTEEVCHLAGLNEAERAEKIPSAAKKSSLLSAY